ncbi:hypothetical protein AOLI_G00099940 [Acnodon oligacanthus]
MVHWNPRPLLRHVALPIYQVLDATPHTAGVQEAVDCVNQGASNKMRRWGLGPTKNGLRRDTGNAEWIRMEAEGIASSGDQEGSTGLPPCPPAMLHKLLCSRNPNLFCAWAEKTQTGIERVTCPGMNPGDCYGHIPPRDDILAKRSWWRSSTAESGQDLD